MPTRIRARYQNQIVTVLDKSLPRRGNVKIRTGHGFVTHVPVRELTPIDGGEPGAQLKYGDDSP